MFPAHTSPPPPLLGTILPNLRSSKSKSCQLLPRVITSSYFTPHRPPPLFLIILFANLSSGQLRLPLWREVKSSPIERTPLTVCKRDIFLSILLSKMIEIIRVIWLITGGDVSYFHNSWNVCIHRQQFEKLTNDWVNSGGEDPFGYLLRKRIWDKSHKKISFDNTILRKHRVTSNWSKRVRSHCENAMRIIIDKVEGILKPAFHPISSQNLSNKRGTSV